MLLAPSWWSILSFDPAVNLPASPVSASKTIYNPGGSSTQEYTQDSGSYFPFAFRERLDIENLDPEADELWNGALNTPLGGFLLVAHNETFYRGWGVSMFHSIHCLSMLRTSFQSYFGLATGPGGHGDHTHGSQGRRRAAGLAGIDERQHVEHCMGYIAKVCNFTALLAGLNSPKGSSRHCSATVMTHWNRRLASLMNRATYFSAV